MPRTLTLLFLLVQLLVSFHYGHGFLTPTTTRSSAFSSFLGKQQSTTAASTTTVLHMNFFQDLAKRFTSRATASHILIKGGAEAENKLEDIKEEIGDSPVKFAEMAAKYSACVRWLQYYCCL